MALPGLGAAARGPDDQGRMRASSSSSAWTGTSTSGGCSSTASSWPVGERSTCSATPKEVDLRQADRHAGHGHDEGADEEDALLPRLRHARQARREAGPLRNLHDHAAALALVRDADARTARSSRRRASRRSSTEVLEDYSTDSEWRLDRSATYPKLDYCVQYDETDFDFVSRLLEESASTTSSSTRTTKHTMVLIDAMGKHEPQAGQGPDQLGATRCRSRTRRSDWYVQAGGALGQDGAHDYDYLAPATEIKGERARPRKTAEDARQDGVVRASGQGRAEQRRSRKPRRGRRPIDAAGEGADGGAAPRCTRSATGTTNVRDLGVGMTFELRGSSATATTTATT